MPPETEIDLGAREQLTEAMLCYLRGMESGAPDRQRILDDYPQVAAELVALGYRFRWTVELFFRWLKCILGCRHLLANSRDGVTIQVYLAIIASLLISLWVGRKPTVRTLEMIQFYFQGWASDTTTLK